MKLLQWLDGKKTYIAALLGGLVTVLQLLGYIEMDLYMTLMSLLGFGGLAALRRGVAKK